LRLRRSRLAQQRDGVVSVELLFAWALDWNLTVEHALQEPLACRERLVVAIREVLLVDQPTCRHDNILSKASRVDSSRNALRIVLFVAWESHGAPLSLGIPPIIRISYYGVWMMDDWSDDIYDALAVRSQALFKNKHLLPVAAWVAENPSETTGAPDVVRGLAGRIAPNKALEALERLRDGGMMIELPFPGPPHARIFQRKATLFWSVAVEFASDAGKAASTPPPASANEDGKAR
jgi:hypothetical protein